MNKKAAFMDILLNNIVYIILSLIVFVSLLAFVRSTSNGAAIWEDFYAKEIVKIIDSAQPGDMITLDVSSATKIAAKNQADFGKIFSFDNEHNKVCVRLSNGGRGCFNFYNEVDVSNAEIKLLEPVNVLKFSITKPKKS